MEPDEIITRISVPLGGPNTGAGYINLGVRAAQDCNIVNVASFLALDADGTISAARIVMGCVGPHPSAGSLGGEDAGGRKAVAGTV